MDEQRQRKLKTLLHVCRPVLLWVGAGLFTALAVYRLAHREQFQDYAPLFFLLIALIWVVEAVSAVFQLLLLPEPREARLRSHNRPHERDPYNYLLLALRDLREGDNGGARTVLSYVDQKTLDKKVLQRFQALKELAAVPDMLDEEQFAQLTELDSAVRQDVDRIIRRRRLLGSLPRAAVLTAVLAVIMALSLPKYPPRCVELRSAVALEGGSLSDTYTLELKTESAQAQGGDEVSLRLSFDSRRGVDTEKSMENELFIQTLGEDGLTDRMVYIPSRMKDPAQLELPFPDTAGFDRLHKVLLRAVSPAQGQDAELDGRACLQYSASVSSDKLSGLLDYQLALFSPELYREPAQWRGGLSSVQELKARLEAWPPVELPLTLWAEDGEILQAEVDTSPLFAALLADLGVSTQAGACTLAIRYASYDPGYITAPEL